MRYSINEMLCVIVLCFVGSSECLAQNLRLTGTVKDADTGEPLIGANVIIKAGDLQRGAATSQSGEFSIDRLQTGLYEINVSYIGYEVYTAEVELREARQIAIALKSSSILFNPISISASRRAEKTLEAPASISVLSAKEIQTDVVPSSASALRNVTGVDMATTGVDRRELVLRGFNNAFSGAAYILTDYRRAAVPSLDVNIHSIMPNMSVDLASIEIVRGPGSALYGAGVDAGVIHYLTKGPFEYPGTTVSITSGERSTLAGEFRHAGLLGEKIGYKLTGQFTRADDWQLNETDSLDAAQLDQDFENPETGIRAPRDYDYQKFNINGMVQYKLSDDASLTANGGYSTLEGTILSGVGTLRSDGFGYTYGQLRLQAGNFFAQGYLNRNQAGDSYIYSFGKSDSGKSVIDESVVLNLQAQYDLSFMQDQEQVIFGIDYDRTNPKTGGTIFGSNENMDLVSELGIYAQSKTKVSGEVDFTAALRADYNNIEEKIQFSPRAAVVFKPSPSHTLRATYNRAYSLPSTTSLFLDITASRTTLADGFTILGVGRGAASGLTFDNARSNGGLAASGLLPSVANNGYWGSQVLYSGDERFAADSVPLSSIYSVLHFQLSQFPVNALVDSLRSRGITNLDSSAIVLALDQLSPTRLDVQGFADSQVEAAPADISSLRATITQTLEVGYKGLLGEKVLLAIDAYYSKKNNFVSGNTQVTPFAYLPSDAAGFSQFKSEFQNSLATGIRGNALLNLILGSVGITPDTVASVILDIAEEDLKGLPVAVVQPDQEQTPGVVVGGYRNYGDVSFWGLDVSLQVLATDNLSFFANTSFVSDDFFDYGELGETNNSLYISLNAPRFKTKTGFSYARAGGVSVNASARFTKAFPVASGPYIGGLPIPNSSDIGGLKDYFLLDVGAGYDLKSFAPGMRIDFTVQNVLNNEHREFIGAPRIGRLALARISYSR
jgi:iron complex outermembrane receptor protein